MEGIILYYLGKSVKERLLFKQQALLYYRLSVPVIIIPLAALSKCRWLVPVFVGAASRKFAIIPFLGSAQQCSRAQEWGILLILKGSRKRCEGPLPNQRYFLKKGWICPIHIRKRHLELNGEVLLNAVGIIAIFFAVAEFWPPILLVQYYFFTYSNHIHDITVSIDA